jgi:hypothetical protein
MRVATTKVISAIHDRFAAQRSALAHAPHCTKRMRTFLAIVLLVLLAASGVRSVDARNQRFKFDDENVPGWALMTSAERVEHHQKLLGFKRLADCRVYMEAHTRKMEARAKARNRILRVPRLDACEQMQAHGLLK